MASVRTKIQTETEKAGAPKNLKRGEIAYNEVDGLLYIAREPWAGKKEAPCRWQERINHKLCRCGSPCGVTFQPRLCDRRVCRR